MQITLKQQHVEAAIKAYVAKAGIQFPVENIDFTNGRGKDGLTATIEMEDPFLVDVPEPVGKTPRSQSFSKRETVAAEEPKEESAPEPEQAEAPEPEPEAKTEEPPFVPDETKEEEAFEAPAPAPEKKKASSLFS